MNNRYFSFGLGVGVCAVLTALLLYGLFEYTNTPNQSENSQRPFNAAAKAQGNFINISGESVGSAILEEGPNGVLVMLELHDLPAGDHAIHIHQTGNCTPVEEIGGPQPVTYFANAGSHLNPEGHAHGLLHSEGPHAGDMPNIHVHQDGTAETQIFNDRITLSEDAPDNIAFLFDHDGASLIIHEGADDYMTPETGNAGDRIACAVIQQQ